MATATTDRLLSDDILARCMERAPGYDRDNRFFQEDFEEIRKTGYLTMAVPRELGGGGLNIAEVAKETRRLAYHSAPTALALNMHVYWTGLVADLWRSGDKSLEWVLKAAMDGEIFAAGHGESGNDLPLLLSTTKAERVDGGYRFTGRKSFGSLTPVWTYLGIHGMDSSDPGAPKIVHAFMPRSTDGYRINEVWDSLGMRATTSEDTVLDGAFVPDQYIARVVPAGGAGIDQFVLGIFAWALLGFGNVYYGNAQRVMDVITETVKSKSSLALSRSMAHHPEVQHAIADMVIEMESIGPHLDSVAQDWANGADYGHGWAIKLMAAKYHAAESTWRVVDTALDVAGGFGVARQAGLERLWRDARLARVHPGNSALTHELIAKTALEINPDEPPRWG